MKTNLRKLLCLALALACVFALAACGSSNSSTPANDVSEVEFEVNNVYKVGIVQFVDDASLNQIEQNIENELDAKAAELGVKFQYTLYNGQADATTLQQIGAELLANNVDIIVPVATPAAQVMQSVTEDSGIPIVFSAVSDPVGAKLVDSLEAPGANITGTSDMLNTEAIMNLMLAANPDLEYVGLLYSQSEDASVQPIADAKAFLESKGIKYIEKTGTNTDEVISAADALVAEGVDAVFTPTDNTIMTAELAIFEKFADAGIPHYAGADSFALNGAFAGYGVDYANLGVMTADMVADILVNEKDVATYGVMTFDNGIVTVNTDTCAAVGFDLETIKTAFADLSTDFIEVTTAENFE